MYERGWTRIAVAAGVVSMSIGCAVGAGDDDSANSLVALSASDVPLLCAEDAMASAGAYKTQNNMWGKDGVYGAYSQCTGIGPVAADGSVSARWTWSWPDGPNEVKGYPAIIHGQKPGMASTPGSGLPARLDAITTATSSWSTASTFTGKGQLTYDLWLTRDPVRYSGFINTPITHEIMIAVEPYGGYGLNRNPAWLVDEQVIGGVRYKVYKADNFGGAMKWRFLVFQMLTPMPTGSIDFRPLFAYLKGKGYITGTEYLSSIEFGSEVEYGSGDVFVKSFRSAVSTTSTSTSTPPSTSPPPSGTGNLVTNGGFESGTAGWDSWGAEVVPSSARTGTWAAELAGNTGAGHTRIAVSPNTRYVLSAWGKTTADEWCAVGYTLRDSSGNVIPGHHQINAPAFYSPTWVQRSKVIDTPGNAASIDVSFWRNAAPGYAYVDDVSLTQAAAENLLTNPGFEAGFTDWDSWGYTIVDEGGEKVARMPASTGGGRKWDKYLPTSAGRQYTLSAWGRRAGSEWFAVSYQVRNAAGTLIQSGHAPAFDSTSWVQKSIDFTTPAGAASINVTWWRNGDAGTYGYIDDLRLVAR